MEIPIPNLVSHTLVAFLVLLVAVLIRLRVAPSNGSFSKAKTGHHDETLLRQGKDGELENTLFDSKVVLPPARREALLELYDRLPSSHPFRRCRTRERISKKSGNSIVHDAVPLATRSTKLSGYEVTPTGFSVHEIRLLGDFPDYELLSGVPLPSAHQEFNIHRALPRPYRPFRWQYHQTMALMKLEPDWWLELDRDYASKIAQRKELFEKHGSQILQYLPGSEMACKELMEIAVQFLCARYPLHFSIEDEVDRDTKKTVLVNGLLETRTALDSQETNPLHVLLNNIPEDFAVMMLEPKTGLYRLRAGVICSSLGWSLGTMIGKYLHEIHGGVPYKDKIAFSMDRYFAKLPTDKPIQRGSWGFEVDKPLFMAPGDPNEHTRQQQDNATTVSRIHLRVDWQTLRRLPLTGALAFNFKALFTPLHELRDEPGVPGLVSKVLSEAPEPIVTYKNVWHTAHVVKPALEAWAKEQVENGLVEEGCEVRTLDQSPFYHGWEERWRSRQGF